jgi:hypothetical protein
LLCRHTSKLLRAPGVRLQRDAFDIRDLSVKDLDWEKSRPFESWPVNPRPSVPGGCWRIKEILLFKEDVSRVLCDGEAASQREPRESAAIAGETAAIRALGAHLSSRPQLTRAEAAEWCRAHGFNISRRGLQYRVWPAAREEAGLEAKAPPGRRRKSSR